MQSTRLQLTALLGCVLFALPTISAAIPITHNFTVRGIDGPLAGVESWGSFTYDNSIMPAGGSGVVGGSATNVDFVLNWGGSIYTENEIKSGGIIFVGGQLGGALFGSVCRTDFSCLLAPLPLGALFLDIQPILPGLFSYNLDGTQRVGVITMKRVPEPSTLALGCLALLALAIGRYRARATFRCRS